MSLINEPKAWDSDKKSENQRLKTRPNTTVEEPLNTKSSPADFVKLLSCLNRMAATLEKIETQLSIITGEEEL